MAHVGFTTPSGDLALIPTGERTYAISLAESIGSAVLDVRRGRDSPWLRSICVPTPPVAIDLWDWLNGRRDRYKTAFALPDNRLYPVYGVFLNTLIKMGSPPLQFLARWEGTCEIHGWVSGPNRAWLSNIVELGVEQNILRDTECWMDLVGMLRRRDDEPVVMYQSSNADFPNILLAFPDCRVSDPEWEKWQSWSHRERFEKCFETLKLNPDLEITLGNLGTVFFNADGGPSSITAFDINAIRAAELRLAMERARREHESARPASQ